METLRTTKDKLTTKVTDMWVGLVTNIEHGKTTWLHKMMMHCNKDCLDFILGSLSADETLQLLKAEDDTNSYPLDKLGDRHSDNSINNLSQKKKLSKSIVIMVMELIKGVSEDDWFFLVESVFIKTLAKLRNTNSTNRFDYHLHILRTVVECVSPHQQLQLLGETNGLDTRLRQYAKASRVECEENIDRLQEYRTEAKICLAAAPIINEQGKIWFQVPFISEIC